MLPCTRKTGLSEAGPVAGLAIVSMGMDRPARLTPTVLSVAQSGFHAASDSMW